MKTLDIKTLVGTGVIGSLLIFSGSAIAGTNAPKEDTPHDWTVICHQKTTPHGPSHVKLLYVPTNAANGGASGSDHQGSGKGKEGKKGAAHDDTVLGVWDPDATTPYTLEDCGDGPS